MTAKRERATKGVPVNEEIVVEKKGKARTAAVAAFETSWT
jgi:hypothetical protein